MENLTMQVELKTVYGNESIYPVSECAKKFAQIAGTRTLTRRTIQLAKELGYEVEVMQQAL